MPPPGDDDVRTMIDYFLGSLPETVAERLDELSITDDDFAVRLTAAEDDLVDAYVRGELSVEMEKRFRSFYLSSPKRQEKVRFAETLLAHERRAALATKPESQGSSIRVPLGEFPKRPRGFFHLIPQWGFAAVAIVLLVVAAFLLMQNRRLNTQIRQNEAERAQLQQNQQELDKRVQQRPADTGPAALPSTAGATSSKIQIASIPAFVLAPAQRGAGSIATISVPADAKQIKVMLQLEAADFSKYRVTLNDPVADHAIWRSGEIRAQAKGEARSVSMLIPTTPLKQQNYIFELSGITSRGTPEFISSYPFRLLLK